MDKETHRENDINLADYPPYKSSNSNSVTLSILFYTVRQIEGQIKSAEFGLNSANLILENTRQEELNNLNEHLRHIQIQYDVGNVAMADLIETKV